MLLRSGGSVNSQSGTLALRIQFNGQDGQNVLRTSQDHIHSLLPWLRAVLTRLHLPHPKPTNVIKPNYATSVVDMYWDHPVVLDSTLRGVVNQCRKASPSTLQELSIVNLVVYVLPEELREIPGWVNPEIELVCSFDNSTTTGPSSSHPTSTELEEALLKIFESIGLSVPTPVENLAAYIPSLSKYHEALHRAVRLEAAARVEAETALAEERARHSRILEDIQMECRAPFVVPALLDAFVTMSQIVDDVTEPAGGSRMT